MKFPKFPPSLHGFWLYDLGSDKEGEFFFPSPPSSSHSLMDLARDGSPCEYFKFFLQWIMQFSLHLIKWTWLKECYFTRPGWLFLLWDWPGSKFLNCTAELQTPSTQLWIWCSSWTAGQSNTALSATGSKLFGLHRDWLGWFPFLKLSLIFALGVTTILFLCLKKA